VHEHVVQAHAAEQRKRKKARDQRQRYPVRDRHGEEVARGCERHQGRKQHKARNVERHG
jgi:hypothetical protein